MLVLYCLTMMKKILGVRVDDETMKLWKKITKSIKRGKGEILKAVLKTYMELNYNRCSLCGREGVPLEEHLPFPYSPVKIKLCSVCHRKIHNSNIPETNIPIDKKKNIVHSYQTYGDISIIAKSMNIPLQVAEYIVKEEAIKWSNKLQAWAWKDEYL